MSRHLRTYIFVFVSIGLLFAGKVLAQEPRIQFVNATAGAFLDTADVYVNGSLWIDDLPSNSGTSFYTLPSTGDFSIGIAPSSSISAADALLSSTFNFSSNQRYSLSIIGKFSDALNPLQFLLDENAKEVSSATEKVEVSWVHAAVDAPGLNVVLRNGPMILGGLEYGHISGYQIMDPEEIFIDVKTVNTTNILSTYRLSLNAEKGNALKILVTGSAASASSLRLFILYADGFSIPVDFAPISRVQYINALNDTVDVYKNGTRFSDDARHGFAMPFKNIPAGINMNIAVCPWASINASNYYKTFSFIFGNAVNYTAVSAGSLLDPAHPLQMYFHENSREASPDTNLVSVLFFHGDYSDNDLSIVDESENTLFEQLSYGSFSEYKEMSAGVHRFSVISKLDNSILFQSGPVDLSSEKGKAIILLTMDLSSSQGHTELWLTKVNGESFALTNTVDVSNVELKKANVYPNPAQNYLVVDLNESQEETVQFFLSDVLGKTHRSGIFLSNREKISLADLPNGAYILNLKSGSGIETRKITINR